MQNAIYYGKVTHKHINHKEHCFTYNVGMFCIDVSDIPYLKTLGILKFKRKNYLPDYEGTIVQAITKVLNKNNYYDWNGKAYILCHLSHFGYCYNPVVFFYCFDKNNNRLQYIIAEIHNTPWGERYQYVIPVNKQESQVKTFKKSFHISPFMPMDLTYTWVFNMQGGKINVYMQSRQQEQLVLSVALDITANKLNKANLLKYVAKSPFRTHMVYFKIYWQALKLFCKRVPFFTHPSKLKNR